MVLSLATMVNRNLLEFHPVPHTTTLAGPYEPPANGAEAEQVVIFLHGYGADGNDLIGLAPMFAQGLPGAQFYAPHAPEPCEMSPFGKQWFSLATYDPNFLRRDPATMEAIYKDMLEGAREVAPILNAFIDERLEEHGISPDKLALVGFSQGTMMALHVALRREEPIAAIVGYSGALIGHDVLADEIKSRPPVQLIHGVDDPVVPYEAMAVAKKGLNAVGIEASTMSRRGLEHGIDPEGIVKGIEFLRDAFGIS